MIDEISIKEFSESGLLWYINQQLHVFGLSIAYDLNEQGEPTRLYPVRNKFRGFNEESNNRGYKRITEYMCNNSKDLLNDIDW